MTQRTTRGAFTLIELLVVVAIIALLIAILLPSLAGARRTSQKSRCASNLYALGRAALMYEGEYGALPRGYRSLFTSGRDIQVTTQYFRSEPTWKTTTSAGTIMWISPQIGGVKTKLLVCPAAPAVNPFDLSATPGGPSWFDLLNGALQSSNNMVYGHYQNFIGDVGNVTGVANRFNYFRDESLSILYSKLDSTPYTTRQLPPDAVLMQDMLWKDPATSLYWGNHAAQSPSLKESYATTSTLYPGGKLWVQGFNIGNDLATFSGVNVLRADGSVGFSRPADLTKVYQINNLTSSLAYTMYLGTPEE